MDMLKCTKCSEKYEEKEVRYLCKCGEVLEVVRKYGKPKLHGIGLRKFKEMLPVERELVSLNEGNTFLHKTHNIEKEHGLTDLYIKFEGTNPTGSFKDRGTAVVITKALEF